jgi:putative transposase
MAGYHVSERRACSVLRFARSSHRYRSCAKDPGGLRIRLRDLAAARARYGYRRITRKRVPGPVAARGLVVRASANGVNHKRIYRPYKQEGLSLRIKRKKRISVQRVPLPPATAPNERRSMDFMTDGLFDGRRIRVLTIVDNFSKVSPVIEADFSFPGRRVVDVLERIVTTTGQVPKVLHVDICRAGTA